MIILLLLLRIVVFALGAYLVFRAFLSALRTFVLPRSAPDRFNRTTFIVMRQLFELRGKRQQTYLERDKVMELYAPVALIALLVVRLFSINLGYIAMDWAIDVQSWYKALNPLFGAVSQLPPQSWPARIHMSGSQYLGLTCLL